MTKLAAIIVLLGLILGCNTEDQTSSTPRTVKARTKGRMIEGGVYASKSEEGPYRITKILALTDSAVHVRFYNEEFDEIPKTISTADLSSLIGHAPITREGFQKGKHHHIVTEKVSDSELEGYRLYLEAMKNR